MHRLDELHRVNAQICDSIKFADSKAAIILAFVSAVGSAVGVAAPAILDAARSLHWTALALGLVACGVVAASVVLVLWNTLAALHPRLEKARTQTVSFPDIAALDPAVYAKRAARVGQEETMQEYAAHNAVLARIAEAKFTAIAGAVAWARWSLFAAYASLLIYAVAKFAA